MEQAGVGGNGWCCAVAWLRPRAREQCLVAVCVCAAPVCDEMLPPTATISVAPRAGIGGVFSRAPSTHPSSLRVTLSMFRAAGARRIGGQEIPPAKALLQRPVPASPRRWAASAEGGREPKRTVARAGPALLPGPPRSSRDKHPSQKHEIGRQSDLQFVGQLHELEGGTSSPPVSAFVLTALLIECRRRRRAERQPPAHGQPHPLRGGVRQLVRLSHVRRRPARGARTARPPARVGQRRGTAAA